MRPSLFSIFQHSHLLGREMELKHIRNGKELKPIAVDKTYDFDYQEMRLLSPEVKLKSGDSLRQECTYSSAARRTFTEGGTSTTEEMCLSFVGYYPKIPVQTCMTGAKKPAFLGYFGLNSKWVRGSGIVVVDGTKETPIDEYFENARWSKEEIKGIEKYEFDNERSHICYANFQYVMDIPYSSNKMEKIKTPYTEESKCPKSNSKVLIFNRILTFVCILFYLF